MSRKQKRQQRERQRRNTHKLILKQERAKRAAMNQCAVWLRKSVVNTSLTNKAAVRAIGVIAEVICRPAKLPELKKAA